MNIDEIKEFEAKLIALEENTNKLAESIKDAIDDNCAYEGFKTTLTLYQLFYDNIKKNYEATCQQDNNSGKIEVLYANDPDDLVEKELIIASALTQLLQQFNITSNALLIAGLNLKKCLFASKKLLNAGLPISCATDYTPQIDTDGYLVDPNNWCAEIAIQIAKNEGISLSQEHWTIIQCLRDFYQEFNVKVIPTRAFLKKLAAVMEPTKCTSMYLYTLFPKGLTQVSKIAGLPKSTRCSKGLF